MSGTSGTDLSWVPALIISGQARRAQALPVMLILQIMPRRQTRGPAIPGGASAGDPDVFCLRSLLALGDVELDLLPFVQAAVAATGDRAEMHEHVRAALDRDEAVTFVAVEPFHGALRHLDLLVVHAAPRHGRGRARHFGSASLSRNAQGMETGGTLTAGCVHFLAQPAQYG